MEIAASRCALQSLPMSKSNAVICTYKEDSFDAIVLADGLCSYLRRRRFFTTWRNATAGRLQKRECLLVCEAIASRSLKRIAVSLWASKAKQQTRDLHLNELVHMFHARQLSIRERLKRWRCRTALARTWRAIAAGIQINTRVRAMRAVLTALTSERTSRLVQRGRAYVALVHYDRCALRKAWRGLMGGLHAVGEEEALVARAKQAIRIWHKCLRRQRPTPPATVLALSHWRAHCLHNHWAAWVTLVRDTRKARRDYALAAFFRSSVLMNGSFQWWATVTSNNRRHRARLALATHHADRSVCIRVWRAWVERTEHKKKSTLARVVAQGSLLKNVVKAWNDAANERRCRRFRFLCGVHRLAQLRCAHALYAWRRWVPIAQQVRSMEEVALDKWRRRACRRAISLWRASFLRSRMRETSEARADVQWCARSARRALQQWRITAGQAGKLRASVEFVHARITANLLRGAWSRWRVRAHSASAALAVEDELVRTARHALHAAATRRIWRAWTDWHKQHMRLAVRSAHARYHARVCMIRAALRALKAAVQVGRIRADACARADRVDAARRAWRAWSVWREAMQERVLEQEACLEASAWHARRVLHRVLQSWAEAAHRRRTQARALMESMGMGNSLLGKTHVRDWTNGRKGHVAPSTAPVQCVEGDGPPLADLHDPYIALLHKLVLAERQGPACTQYMSTRADISGKPVTVSPPGSSPTRVPAVPMQQGPLGRGMGKTSLRPAARSLALDVDAPAMDAQEGPVCNDGLARQHEPECRPTPGPTIHATIRQEDRDPVPSKEAIQQGTQRVQVAMHAIAALQARLHALQTLVPLDEGEESEAEGAHAESVAAVAVAVAMQLSAWREELRTAQGIT